MLNEQAGVIDDLILYRMEPETFFVVVNASRIDEDFAWLSAHKPADVTLENHSDEYVGLAVQGPLCGAIFAKVIPGVELPPRNRHRPHHGGRRGPHRLPYRLHRGRRL